MNIMNSALKARRATTEDIGRLSELWKLMRLPAEELAKRVTEFQVIEDAQGNLVGAAALEISEKQGRLHSEGFVDFAQSDETRPMLWDRIMALATNHGLLNVWTQEQAPFWKHTGFAEPDEELRLKMPAGWKKIPGKWFALKLRDDVDAVLAADKEFKLFMQSERARTERALQHAKMLKVFATLIAAGVFVLVLMAAWYLIRHQPAR